VKAKCVHDRAALARASRNAVDFVGNMEMPRWNDEHKEAVEAYAIALRHKLGRWITDVVLVLAWCVTALVLLCALWARAPVCSLDWRPQGPEVLDLGGPRPARGGRHGPTVTHRGVGDGMG
jgi:hypothetical protein